MKIQYVIYSLLLEMLKNIYFIAILYMTFYQFPHTKKKKMIDIFKQVSLKISFFKYFLFIFNNFMNNSLNLFHYSPPSAIFQQKS